MKVSNHKVENREKGREELYEHYKKYCINTKEGLNPATLHYIDDLVRLQLDEEAIETYPYYSRLVFPSD